MRKSLAVFLTAFAVAAPAQSEPITIFAASSMKTALDQVVAESGLDAIAAYGGSATIARQLAQGAEADIVILAHNDWMDWLEGQGALQSGSRCDLLGNELVLAGPANSIDLDLNTADDLLDALDGGRLAVGQLLSVPAGQYTAAFLEQRGWLTQLRPHLAETSNVRLALALVARGQAPLGFVYASDVAAQPDVRALFKPDPALYPSIRYPLALSADAQPGAAEMLQILTSAGPVFAQNGFHPLPSDDPTACSTS
ncbi:molybdate ABC transporter substrate-binding protein [Planktotalea sp.]|uniref:molybdate ABC transporter substrate-binding protein n=1 Tax=Planktotalea sp. TaxID=2029877 RepID=UPI003297EF6F